MHDSFTVPGDRFRTNTQLFSNLVVGIPFCHGFQHLQLALTEHIQSFLTITLIAILPSLEWGLG